MLESHDHVGLKPGNTHPLPSHFPSVPCSVILPFGVSQSGFKEFLMGWCVVCSGSHYRKSTDSMERQAVHSKDCLLFLLWCVCVCVHVYNVCFRFTLLAHKAMSYFIKEIGRASCRERV